MGLNCLRPFGGYNTDLRWAKPNEILFGFKLNNKYLTVTKKEQHMVTIVKAQGGNGG